MKMRRIFTAALALMSFAVSSVAIASPKSAGYAACYSNYKTCEITCNNDKTLKTTNCWQDCTMHWFWCQSHVSGAQIDIRTFAGNAGGKDFPGGSGGATTGPNTHAVGAMTNGMSASPGAASGPASTRLNPPLSSSHSKPTAGGSGLLSGPGMPNIKAH
jgi:hypothetical protein